MGELDVVRWRAWYVGGEVHDGSSFEDWQRLPDDGVLYVLLGFSDRTHRNENGDDWYWATPDGVYAHDTRQTREEIERRYPGASIKRGMWTTDAEMMRAHDEAQALAAEWRG